MGGMDEKPNPKFRFSLRAALAAMLTIGVALGVARIAWQDPRALLVVAAITVCTLGAAIAHGLRRDPTEGIAWGILVLIIAAALIPGFLFPAVQY